jgi:HlyD family secretion protein
VRKNTIIPVLLLVLSTAGCGTTNDTAIQASGQIEAKEIVVASELSGRVAEVFAAEGDSVTAGDPLLRLDDSLLLSEKQAAKAAMDSAHASVRVAQSTLDSALAQYEMALTSALFEEALLTRKNRWKGSKPDEYNQPVWYFSKVEQIRSAKSAVASARDALSKAQNNLNEISKRTDNAEFLEIERSLSDSRMAFDITRAVLDSTDLASDETYLRDAAQVAHDKAIADLKDAQKDYNKALTNEGANNVLKARAGLEVAREQYYTALDTLRALQTGEQSITVLAADKAVDQARAVLDQAESAVAAAQPSLDLISKQMDRLTIRAPMDGTVLIRSIEAGEVLQAGMPAMTIGKLDELKVRVYIPVTEYGQLSLGQQANLTADSFAGEIFAAKVTRIAEKFEFTPQNVQTREGRQTTVYAIELAVENTDGRLKPGMPVDVTFETVAK